ncbi:MAG: hypothetical protein RLZZ385_2554 [Pseudomonadota bacterium]|jgi:type II secretory pathway pseudopilin PulG
MEAAGSSTKPTLTLQQCDGFSLFELVVFIICVAIIYASASNRFADFPGEAERANFLAVTAQIQAAVNLELMMGMVERNGRGMEEYQSANPMDFLLEAPSNYLGEFFTPNVASLPKRSWYFDQQTRELVYLINDAEDVYLVQNGVQVPTTEIRFHIELEYRGEGLATISVTNAEQLAANRGRRLAGMVLRPVTPYVWGSAPSFMEYYESPAVSG